jgi:hypothetical protein
MTEEQPGEVAIRTPDQRLRVFVSSTLAELAEERAAVARAISALRPRVYAHLFDRAEHAQRAQRRARGRLRAPAHERGAMTSPPQPIDIECPRCGESYPA